jgi:hypothetical protein
VSAKAPRAPALLGVLALAAQGCSLAAVDYTGKTCPCGDDGYRCNEATGLCEPPAGSAAGPGCTPRVVPTDFRVGWTTPNAIRWQWDGAPAVDELGAYRLMLAPSAELLEAGEQLTVFDATRNPELGEPYLRGTEGIDPVAATLTDALEPETTYHGRLATLDNAGCEHLSPILAATTSFAPTARFTLFEDELPEPGETLPPSVAVGSGPSGSPCLAYTATCGGGQETCFENVRLKLAVEGAAIAAEMTEGDFAALAYLELDVATDSMVAATSWGLIRLWSTQVFALDGQVFSGGGAMRTYQIPLRALIGDNDTPLTYADLTTAGLEEVGVGNTWSAGSHVWIDRISLRW